MKFLVGGTGQENAGAGWIGNHYFSYKNEPFETDDPAMIELLRKSGLAKELIEQEEAINQESETKRARGRTKVEGRDT